jgi:hypothetical protein
LGDLLSAIGATPGRGGSETRFLRMTRKLAETGTQDDFYGLLAHESVVVRAAAMLCLRAKHPEAALAALEARFVSEAPIRWSEGCTWHVTMTEGQLAARLLIFPSCLALSGDATSPRVGLPERLQLEAAYERLNTFRAGVSQIEAARERGWRWAKAKPDRGGPRSPRRSRPPSRERHPLRSQARAHALRGAGRRDRVGRNPGRPHRPRCLRGRLAPGAVGLGPRRGCRQSHSAGA